MPSLSSLPTVFFNTFLDMHALLTVLVVGAEMTSSDLSSDISAATAELVIGAGSTMFWGAMPQPTLELTAHVGTKLVFKWGVGHDVVITSSDAWGKCKLEAHEDENEANFECLAVDQYPSALCDGANNPTKTGNKFVYEAVVKRAGEYYFTCSHDGHCSSGQKVKVTVTLAPPSSPPLPPSQPLTPEESEDSPQESEDSPQESDAEDSAAAALGSSALRMMLLIVGTTVLLQLKYFPS